MIFLAGVSGSGKTYAARAAAATGKFRHVRASKLLAEAGRPISSLSASEALRNQEALLITVAREKGHGVTEIIFDGHVSIETIDEGLIPVPDWFFDGLGPDKIICMVVDSVLAASRLSLRGHHVSATQIETVQDYEIACARRQAERLDILYSELASVDPHALLAAAKAT